MFCVGYVGMIRIDTNFPEKIWIYGVSAVHIIVVPLLTRRETTCSVAMVTAWTSCAGTQHTPIYWRPPPETRPSASGTLARKRASPPSPLKVQPCRELELKQSSRKVVLD